MNIIYGDLFKDLCFYECKGAYVEQLKGYPTGHGGSSLGQLHFMFTETHNLKMCLEHCRKMAPDWFVVISGNSDANILDHPGRNFDFHFKEEEIPENVEMIWAQNVDVVSPKIKCLPIFLENEKWHKKKKWKEIESMIPQEFKRDKLLYINHSIATNPPEREEPYRIFKNKGWATCKDKVSYLEYLTDLKTHKFRICPNGNGAAVHSMWESLYMGNTPIMKKKVFTEVFSRIMPIVLVDEWSDVTLEFLNTKYEEIKNTKYEHDYLSFDYWKNLIMETA